MSARVPVPTPARITTIRGPGLGGSAPKDGRTVSRLRPKVRDWEHRSLYLLTVPLCQIVDIVVFLLLSVSESGTKFDVTESVRERIKIVRNLSKNMDAAENVLWTALLVFTK